MEDDKGYYERLEKRFEWAKWRWEFLRRNPQFRKDYEEIKVLLKKRLQGNLAEVLDTEEQLKLGEFLSKWDEYILYPLDIDKSLEEMLKDQNER